MEERPLHVVGTEPQPSEDLLALVDMWRGRVLRGELKSIAVAAITTGDGWATGWAHHEQFARRGLSLCEVVSHLSHRMHRAIDEADE